MKPIYSVPFRLTAALVFFSSLVDHPAIAQSTFTLDENTFGAIEARAIGPANMSGRIAALDAVASDPRVIYVGAAAGGVWKSKNAGTTFKAIFDEYTQSIGAIAIDQAHPDTVWVGTGETWVRNSVSVGDGIYRTKDGGEKWEHFGLEKTERIARIIIHPQNPDILFVAAVGPLWNASPERGVFKTLDGGKTWTKILYVDENTGCSDLAIDPENPDILYAGMWDFRRQPYSFRSGGPGSGLFRSEDGGQSWNKITENLPAGNLGRIALAVSPANPKIVWAAIEAKKSVLLRSNDRGLTWKEVNSDPVMGERPFYFALLVADTKDTNRLYKPGYSLNVSNDGGKSFQSPFVGGGNVHSDLHALWVSPADPNFLYLGTDGGLFLSHDRGNTWKMIRNLPLSQFYRVTVDSEMPYNVYGGLQDNGSWYGPSKSPSGINNRDWENVGYGDGFNVACDPADNNIVYWQYQGGEIKRFYKDTREFKDIKPYADASTEELRFNWNAPMKFGRRSGALYVGSQYLYRSTDRGDRWDRISPDLTSDDPERQKQEETGGLTTDNSSAENHCTIYAIGESPLHGDVIWVGTDDGKLQLTTDGGKKWSDLTANIPGLPPGTWCSYACPGEFDQPTAYVTFDGHRTGDMKPYVYRTTDYGQTWNSLSTESIKGYCHVVRQDLVNPDLLFLGTECGLYLSVDGGTSWTRFKGKIPMVPVMELEIHPTEHDLIIATHGRGILIIDDLTPIRQLKPELLDQDLVFLGSRPFRLGYIGGEQRMEGDDEFTGDNPSDVCQVTYYLKKRHVFGDMFIEIFDQNDSLIEKLPAGTRKGINRVPWVTLMDPPKVPSSVQLLGQALRGPTLPPGEYRVRITKGENTYNSQVTLIWDPDSRHSTADRDLRQEKLMKAYNLLEDLAWIDRQITDIRDKSSKTKELATKKSLDKRLEVLIVKMNTMHEEIVPVKVGGITGEERLRERLATIYGGIMGYGGRPTDSQIERLDLLVKSIRDLDARLNQVIGSDLAAVNVALEKEGMEEIILLTRAEFDKEN
jgi:photosystem II stability/assembly factor-like uncharacterized protein